MDNILVKENTDTVIKDVADLTDVLKQLGKAEKNKTRFFRGHSNYIYEITPGIYRERYLIKNEEKIIRDALTYCSESFSPHETLFEKLVKLQHYGYKTRLLDITTNALVSLYFSVESLDNFGIPTVNKETDGEIIIFDIPNEFIKYDDSDTVSILSAISLRDKNFNINEFLEKATHEQIIETILSAEKIVKIRETLIKLNERESNKELINECLIKLGFESIDAFFSKKLTNNTTEILTKIFNGQKDIIKLLHDIRQDKPSFLPIINHEDLNKVLCVKAKTNNPRIARQQGAFLLFGMHNEKMTKAHIPSEWQRTLNRRRFIIRGKDKENIMKELEFFGINRPSLFPELEAQAKYIMNRYTED